MRLPDEPSKTEIRGVWFAVDYDRNDAGIWSCTLKHPRMGSYTTHEYTPSRAREKCRKTIAESFDAFMEQGAQRHAHEVAAA